MALNMLSKAGPHLITELQEFNLQLFKIVLGQLKPIIACLRFVM